jgi:hypothetical protein
MPFPRRSGQDGRDAPGAILVPPQAAAGLVSSRARSSTAATHAERRCLYATAVFHGQSTPSHKQPCVKSTYRSTASTGTFLYPAMCWYPNAAISAGSRRTFQTVMATAYQYALSTKGLQEVLCNGQALLEYRLVHLHPGPIGKVFWDVLRCLVFNERMDRLPRI